MSKHKDYVEVKISKELVEEIQKDPFFKHYRDVDEFVAEAVRSTLFKLKKAEAE